MTFKKWPRVENSYRQEFIDRFLAEFPELAEETFVLTEKLHGKNIQVFFEPNKPWRVGKRTAWLAEGEKFSGIWDVLPEYNYIFNECQWWSNKTGLTFRLFGELVGPGVQKGVDYGKKKEIYFFGHMIEDTLQPFGNLVLFAIMHGFRKHLVPRIRYIEGLAAALAFNVELVSELNPVKGNICEGVVIQPFERTYTNAGGKRFLLKKKNEKFAEKARAKKPPSPGDPEVRRLNEEFRLYITDTRLQGIFSKRGEIEEPSQIGDYIRMMLADAKEDFMGDHGDAFNALTKAEQRKALNVGGLIANMLKKAL